MNKEFKMYEPIVKEVRQLFEAGNEVIHQARNVLKVVEFQGKQFVIKRFKVPHLINRFAYTHVRKSKAYKSFHNAMRLINKEIATPDPVGYIEFYEQGFIKDSYYVSLYTPYDFLIREVLENKNFYNRDTILEAFATFTFHLHEAHVWHQDYSPGNILVNNNEGEYTFSLVDINRMQFRHIPTTLGLKNFNKLWADKEDLTKISSTYAQLAHQDLAWANRKTIRFDKKHKAFTIFKRRIRGKK
jgi:serine/threonine protein kinase